MFPKASQAWRNSSIASGMEDFGFQVKGDG